MTGIHSRTATTAISYAASNYNDTQVSPSVTYLCVYFALLAIAALAMPLETPIKTLLADASRHREEPSKKKKKPTNAKWVKGMDTNY